MNCRDCPAWNKSAFKDLSAERLEHLERVKTESGRARKETFNVKGAPASTVYCIRKGNAKISRPGQHGKESIVRIASGGDLLGYRCIFSEKSFRATAIALEPTEVCEIGAAHVFELIREESAFAMEMLRRMGREIASAENRHHSFVQRNVRERVAEALLLLARICGTPIEDGWLLDIQLTRTEFSSWVGAAKETVVRCLSDFKDEGLVGQEGTQMTVLDERKLAEIAKISFESAVSRPGPGTAHRRAFSPKRRTTARGHESRPRAGS